MAQSKISIATLGTKEEVIKVTATVTVTAGADTTSTEAVTFDNEFVSAPEVISVISKGTPKATPSVDTVTATGMNVNLWQENAGDVVSDDYEVEVFIIGRRKA